MFLCWGGAALAVLLLCDIAPVPVLGLLWLFYLSLAAVSRDFLMFQWDILLLETGFLAIFLAPWRRRPAGSAGPGPRPVVTWLFRWLLFRVVFASGLVKLLSGDESWRDLSALSYHYLTQPLPTPLAWRFYHLPLAFHKISALEMFGIELVVPFLFLAPRVFRQAGALITAGYQVLIMATGNYGFLNLLTITLCIMLLDDTVWPGVLKKRLGGNAQAGGRPWPRWAVAPVAGLLLFLSAVEMGGLLRVSPRLLSPAVEAARLLAPFRFVNGYGLFAAMTTMRPEIIVEGSHDQVHWRAYEFRWKPGELSRRPPFAQPHQPRLDWQMWIAALGSYRENLWFMNLCARLLQGSEPVLRLLKTDPFPEGPPRYVRGLVYGYSFNSPEVRRATGEWWSRELKGLYCPVLSLRSDEPAEEPAAAPSGGESESL